MIINRLRVVRFVTQMLLLTAACTFAFSLNYLYAAVWQGPPAGTPPANNVDSPINVGTTNQVKDANLSVGHSANTASDYGLISYGRLRTTIGGVEFPDGTVQTTAGSGGGLTAIRSYSSSGTWTKPAGLSYVVVEVWGGGGAGENYAGTPGTAGGSSSFGSHVSATGGATPSTNYIGGVGGIGSNGDLNLRGGTGTGVQGADGGSWDAGGHGGLAPRGGQGSPGGYGAVTQGGVHPTTGIAPGGGGGGSGGYHNGSQYPSAGGGGGYSMKRIAASSLGATETITVGAGGVGVANANGNGGNGGAGMVIVTEYQ